MTLQEFIDSIDNWTPGHYQKMLDDFDKGLSNPNRTRIHCSGMRDMGFLEQRGQWFHQENVWVDREGVILERAPGPEDPMHFRHLSEEVNE